MRTLADWLDFISRQHSAEMVLGLERVGAVWRAMGCPQAPLNIVVGGTNGKGSTCAMLAAILDAAGYRVGFYSSPHLLRFNERIRIGRRDIDDASLMTAFEAVETARQSIGAIPLTYFEYATLAALRIFQQAGLEAAILEVGLGGRLDAVNLIDADASVVVSVDLDHMAYLGDTVEQIAWEKAHIFRPGRLAIFGARTVPATLLDHAEAIGAALHVLGRDFSFTRMGDQWQWRGTIGGREQVRHALPMPALRGGYQLQNASVALAVLVGLADRLPVAQQDVRRGLLEVVWPGRMQVLPGRPMVVLDVAHNPHAARALDEAIGGLPYAAHTYAVFGMLKDKDIGEVIRVLAHRVDHWFVAGLPGERGASAEHLIECLTAAGAGDRIECCTDIRHAFAAARNRAGPDDRILGFGSFLTVAELLALHASE